ncbi:hypothetical protein HK101_002443, partial [Irineochytrium annulatum]
MKNDPLYGYATVSAIYRAALIRGDANAAEKWKEAYDSSATMAAAVNFGIGTTHCIRAFVEALHANFQGALKHMEGYLAVLPTIGEGTDGMDMTPTITYVMVLLVDPVRSGLPYVGFQSNSHAATQWSEENARLLIT